MKQSIKDWMVSLYNMDYGKHKSAGLSFPEFNKRMLAEHRADVLSMLEKSPHKNTIYYTDRGKNLSLMIVSETFICHPNWIIGHLIDFPVKQKDGHDVICLNGHYTYDVPHAIAHALGIPADVIMWRGI